MELSGAKYAGGYGITYQTMAATSAAEKGEMALVVRATLIGCASREQRQVRSAKNASSLLAYIAAWRHYSADGARDAYCVERALAFATTWRMRACRRGASAALS